VHCGMFVVIVRVVYSAEGNVGGGGGGGFLILNLGGRKVKLSVLNIFWGY